MTSLPKIKTPTSNLGKIIKIFGAVLFGISWYYLLSNYGEIPLEVPTHFNYEGVADNFGNKIQLFKVLGIGTVIYVAIFIAGFFPHKLNYLAEITEENAFRHYSLGKELLLFINLAISITISYLSMKTVHNVLNGQTDLDAWMSPVILVIIFAPLVYYLVKLAKK